MRRQNNLLLIKTIIIIFCLLFKSKLHADIFIYNGLKSSIKVRTLATSDYKKNKARRKLSASLRECNNQACQFELKKVENMLRVKTKPTFHKKDMGILKIIIDDKEAEKIRKKIVRSGVLMGVAWAGAAVAAGAITAATFGAGAVAAIPILAGTATTVIPFALEISSLRKSLKGLTMKTAYTKNDIFFLMPREMNPSEAVDIELQRYTKELILVTTKDWGSLYVQKRADTAVLPKNAISDLERLSLLKQFTIGDSIETVGGVIGEIVNIDDDRIEIRSGRSIFSVRKNAIKVTDPAKNPEKRVVKADKNLFKVHPAN